MEILRGARRGERSVGFRQSRNLLCCAIMPYSPLLEISPGDFSNTGGSALPSFQLPNPRVQVLIQVIAQADQGIPHDIQQKEREPRESVILR